MSKNNRRRVSFRFNMHYLYRLYGRMRNSIVSVHDHCLFIYLRQKYIPIEYHRSLSLYKFNHEYVR